MSIMLRLRGYLFRLNSFCRNEYSTAELTDSPNQVSTQSEDDLYKIYKPPKPEEKPYRTLSAAKSADLSYLYRHDTAVPPPGVNNYVYNRNPRNFELLRLAPQNAGYHLEKPGRSYWHKLSIKQSSRHFSAALIHNTDVVVLTASTSEWCVKKFLSSSTDRKACKLLAQLFARRCLECGISEMSCFYDVKPDTKLALFIDVCQENGLTFTEPKPLTFPRNVITKERPEVPWEIVED